MKSHIYNLLAQNNFAYSTDTRTIKKGDVFFALSGENFNGNAFARKALEAGAAFVIIDDVNYQEKDDKAYILVDSTYDIFLEIATHHRQQFSIPIIAIAGSNGKTTTKELVTAVLSPSHNVLSTKHNDNNNLGVAQTLMSIRSNHDMVVIELGSNTPGELQSAIDIAQPTHGLVTNIGKEHLEFFNSIQGVIDEECGLYTYLSENDGYLLAPGNDIHIQDFLNQQNIQAQTIYGEATSISQKESLSLKLDWGTSVINAQLFGDHNKQNIDAALALGLLFEVDAEEIISALESYTPDNMRSQIVELESTTYILDFYNANPSSMLLALESFQKIITNKKKVVILGDMLEMGDHADAEHKNILDYVETMDVADAFFGGPYFGKLESKYHHYENIEDLAHAIGDYNFDDTLVLIKSSKGVLYIHEGFRKVLGI